MNESTPFVNYYGILQVDPACDAKTLEDAYRYLAKTYHPDHVETADVTKFNEVIEAYRAIRTPEQRAEYDLQFTQRTGYIFPSDRDALSDDKAALSDANERAKVLMLLYRKRRENALEAGVAPYLIQEALNSSDELMEFHLWYLKAKGFIEMTEQGIYAITIDGIDHVASISRTAMKERLLIAGSGEDRTSSEP